MGPHPGRLVFLYKKEIGTQRQSCTQRRCHMKMRAEIRVMGPQMKRCQTLPENHHELEDRPGKDSPSLPSEGTIPVHILISKVQLWELGDDIFPWLKLPSLRYFDKAGPENSHSMRSSTPHFTEAKPQESYVMCSRPHGCPTARIESIPGRSWLPSYHPRPHLCPCSSASVQQGEENQCKKSQKADTLWSIFCFSIKSNIEVIAVSKFIYSFFHLKQKMTARNAYFLISEGKQLF